jgi:hypothetical protein
VGGEVALARKERDVRSLTTECLCTPYADVSLMDIPDTLESLDHRFFARLFGDHDAEIENRPGHESLHRGAPDVLDP